MSVRLARGLVVLAITLAALAGGGLATSAPADAAQCYQPGAGGGQLMVDFEFTNDAIEIGTDGFGFYYVSMNGFLVCQGPKEHVTSIRAFHSGGTQQVLALNETAGDPWALTDGVTVDSGVTRVQIINGISAPGAIAISSPVDACNGGVALTSGTSITIDGPIDTAPHVPGACDPSTEDFTLTAPAVTVTGAIGATSPIDSLTIASQTSRATIGGSVTTTGTQAYNGAGLAISGSRTLTASSVTASGGIDGATGSSLTISQSGTSEITGQITGGLALAKSGSGTLTLWANNTYTGATTVSAGTLDVINNNGLGDMGTGTTVAAGATLRLRSAIFPWDPITLASTATLQSTGTQTNVLNGALATTGTPTIDIADTATLALSGGITGGGFTKTGTGTLTLNAAATNTGAITVSGGLLRVTGPADSLGTGAGGTTVSSGGALELAGSGTITEPLTIAGTGISSGGALVTSTAVQTISSSLAVGAGATVSTGTALTVSGSVSGTGLLTKVGAARLTLSGSNGSHAGGTRVSAGELRVSAASGLGSAGVTIDGGATLTVDGVTLPSGNTIATTGSGTAEIAGTGSARADGAVTLGAALRLAPATGGSLQLTGAINGAQAITAANGTNGVTRLTGRIGGTTPPASITATGTGTTALGADASTSGAQTYAGTLQIGADLRLTASALEGSATLASDGATRQLTVDASSATAGTYAGQVQSNVAITKAGSGRLVLSGASGSAAAMRVEAGTLAVAAGGALPAVTVAGGTLAGAGTTGAVTSGGSGTISVAAPSGLTTGSLGSSGLTIDVGTLNAGSAGTAYGQIGVVGTVDLTGAALTATRGTTAAGDSFTIIANDGSDAVTGTFTGLAEGAAPAGWTGWSISYRGGDGNDVVLARAGGAAPDSGSGDAAGAGTGAAAGGSSAGGGGASAGTARTTAIRPATAKRRVVTVVIDAAQAGTAALRVTGKGAKTCTATRRVAAAGAVTLRCTVKGTGKAVRAVTAFTPTAGSKATRTDRLRLR